jgi:HlyD family secretion protein
MRKVFRRRRTYGLLSVALLFGGFGAGLRLLPSHAASVQAAGPTPELSVAEGVICFGHVDLEHGVTSLHPLTGGRVVEVAVQEGNAVPAGAVLVRLDDRAAKGRVREAEADLRAAEGQLAQARTLPQHHERKVAQQRAALEVVRHRLAGAETALAHKRTLLRDRLASADDVRVAQAQVDELKAAQEGEREKARELELDDPAEPLRQAQAQLEIRRARLEEARREVDECALKAPADGTVLRVLVNVGDVPGAQPAKPAVLFCPRGPRIIRAEVEQEFAGRVRAGQEAVVQDDTSAGPRWRGHVVRRAEWFTERRAVSPEPAQFTDVRTLEFIVALEPGAAPLPIGQRVRVTIGAAS